MSFKLRCSYPSDDLLIVAFELVSRFGRAC